jgi:O-antigen ligase
MFHAAVVTLTDRSRFQNAFGRRARARLELPSARIAALPAIVAFAVVSVVGYSGGGFFPRTWRLSLLALLAVSAAALVARDRIAVSRREWVVVGALAALAAWTATSFFWSSLPSDSLLEAERTLLYVVALLAVLLGVTRASLPALLIGALAGATTVSAYALGFYVFLSPPTPDVFQGWHLFEPFGYANAVGLYAALGILLSIGLALWARSWAGRAATLSPLLVFVPTLYYTSSRGAWVALPVGLLATLYLGRRIRSRGRLLALLGAALVAGLALGSERGQSLSLFGEHRPTYWRIAWEDVETNSVLGSGAGTFGRFLLQEGSTPYYAHDAHSLYLETLAELGPLGLVLLVVGLVVPVLALRGPQGPIAAAAGGVYIAFLIHAGVDWDWEFSAVGLLGLLSAASSRASCSSGSTLRVSSAPVLERRGWGA